MSIFSKAATTKEATEKMVKIHIIFVVSVCIAFGIINAVSGTVVIGILTAAAGVLVAVACNTFLAKTSTTFRGMLLSQIQLLLIRVMSAVKHELHAMFPLMGASMTIAAI